MNECVRKEQMTGIIKKNDSICSSMRKGMPEGMQIAQISKADAAGGGASTVAEMLFDSLPCHGVSTLHYCSYADKGFNYRRRLIGGFNSSEININHAGLKSVHGLSEVVPLEADFFKNELKRFYLDILHFHDLSSAVSPLTLANLSKIVPVVWTIHDCSAFTGGCLYPMGCENALNDGNCHDCPQVGMWPLDTPEDTAWLNRSIRQYLHRLPDIHLVSPSRWMAEEANKSGVEKPITVIPNGIPEDDYKDLSRSSARSELGIKPDRLVICFSAGHLSDERKNITDAIKALHAVGQPGLTVILLGRLSDDVKDALGELDYISPGYISDRKLLATYLSASDAFLFTSLAENHPLAVLEAMAASTCVIGYDTGGVAEQVIDGKSGLLVTSGDCDALMELARTGLDRDRLDRLGKAARKRYESEFTIDIMADRYVELYTSLLSKVGGRLNG